MTKVKPHVKPTKTIAIRGRKLGSESPLICSPLVARTAQQLLAEGRAVLAKRPDVVEWRVDYFQGIADTAAVVKAGRSLRKLLSGRPLIFTCRSAREGGQPTNLDSGAVARLYDAVGAEGLVDFVDFEMGNASSIVSKVVDTAHQHDTRVILSYHNFKRTPGTKTLVGKFMKADRMGADVAKVAVMPENRLDVLALLAATAQADAGTRIPLISMSMGPLGAVTRMVGGVFGSALSFAVGKGSSAPGQLPIADLRSVYEIIERTHRA